MNGPSDSRPMYSRIATIVSVTASNATRGDIGGRVRAVMAILPAD